MDDPNDPVSSQTKPASPTGKQRMLIMSSVFPPDVIGGAEMTADNLAQFMMRQNYEVAVLTTAKVKSEAGTTVREDGLKIYKVWMPRLYSKYYFAKASSWQKPIWHLQDHLDPRNRFITARVLDDFQPDFIEIHVLQGLGYNALIEIARRHIPVTYFLHDLSLACFRMSMFKNGKDCGTQCAACDMSSRCKLHYMNTLPNVAFVSPSQANLDKLDQFFPVKHWTNKVILNPNRYPKPTAAVEPRGAELRLTFVGRYHSTKGIEFLLGVLDKLSDRHKFILNIVGRGPDEKKLKAKYGEKPWARFLDFLPQTEISNILINTDLFCLPSLWAENSPGVVIHALGLGIPCIASNTGGVPELVQDGHNGFLIEPGDEELWEAKLNEILKKPAVLAPLRETALREAYRFDQEFLGNEVVKLQLEQVAEPVELI